MKRIVVLGATGSIGRSTLEVIARFPDRFRVVGLSARRNVELLAKQARRFRPEAVAVTEEGALGRLKILLGDNKIRILFGEEDLSALAGEVEADVVVNALVGAVGLKPTLAAIGAGRDVALANKETLVMAGDLVMRKAREQGVRILPIDSEHSAIWQCLRAGRGEEMRRLILTASGGPFWGKEGSEEATVEEVLAHPIWQMGQKVTVDSATMMNKGLEVIEAHWLFGIPVERIEVVVHPQSVVHSLVEFRDGSLIAQLGWPDMRLPIQYALTYPERLPGVWKPLDLAEVGALSFYRPDVTKFRCLALGYEAAREGGTAPAVLNAANEVAVNAFLEGRISFGEIARIDEAVMARHRALPDPSLEEVLEVDRWARCVAGEWVEGGRV
ncbi:MAG TPA: 1-deoxy-D-xylulose-5-phosphate reductoisomerase [Candidatus Latescibacteria bacterium]|nr:1-deoxy-D-xylulose-5-phosphate reductoisomerase [Candidatus Latescibacterota bacterium]